VKIEITATGSYTGKLNTGEYLNQQPYFGGSLKFEIEIASPDSVDEALELQNSLSAQITRNAFAEFEKEAQRTHMAKLKNDFKNFHFYNGYISVTSVLGVDFDWKGTDDQLKIAISEGNIEHFRAEDFIKCGEWKEPLDINNCIKDMNIIRELTRKRFVSSWDFPAFLEKFPLKDLKNGYPIYNHTLKYAGTFDAECLYPLGGDPDADEVATLIDFKRTPDENKNFVQLSAYAKCDEMKHIKQIMIIGVKPDTKQGFSKPKITTELDKYFEIFAYKREDFKRTFKC